MMTSMGTGHAGEHSTALSPASLLTILYIDYLVTRAPVKPTAHKHPQDNEERKDEAHVNDCRHDGRTTKIAQQTRKHHLEASMMATDVHPRTGRIAAPCVSSLPLCLTPSFCHLAPFFIYKDRLNKDWWRSP
jgi:hypothetical protein